MSGDVFGNGMLLPSTSGSSPPTTTGTSSSTRRRTPPAGFAERKRLFELAALVLGRLRPRADLRGRRRVPAHREVDPAVAAGPRGAGRVEDASLPPNDVIRAILRAPVDLLWNGGIGTVVKASTETDADAADRSSDAIRVDATELRAQGRRRGRQPRLHAPRAGRVRGRRRAHQRRLHRQLGGRGLLRPRGQPQDPARAWPSARGELTREERDELLFEVTDDVVAHVLYDSFLQAQIIAQEVDRSGLAAVRLRGPDGPARGARAARRALRGPADHRGDRRAPPRRPRHGAARARDAARLLQAAARARAGAARTSSTSRGWSATCASTSRAAVVKRFGPTCWPSTRCAGS